MPARSPYEMSDLTGCIRPRARNAYMTVRRNIGHMCLDRPHAIDTAREVDLVDLGVDAHHRVRYEPSGWRDLRRILRVDDVSTEDVFVDVGSGKGRVVLQAARYPFRRIVGVELSGRLTAIAAANIQASRTRLRCTDIELVTADIVDYELPADSTVVYLYNPFRGPVFQSFVDELIASVDRHPRTVRVIYRTPMEQSLLMATGRVRLVRHVPGLRPGHAWSQKMAIHMYQIEPRVDPSPRPESSR